MNDVLVDRNYFDTKQSISLIFFDLDLGVYNFTILVTDTSGNSISDQVRVDIVESLPPVISSPADQLIVIDENSNNITWILEDTTPDHYSVYQNSTLISEGTWNNGDTVVVDLDTLEIGVYIFELFANDTYGSESNDSVTITIIDLGYPTLSSPDDIFITENNDGHKIIWEISDNDPDYFILEENGVVIRNETLLNVFFIEVILDDYVAGNYNFTLTIFDFSNFNTTDEVEVQIFAVDGGIPTDPVTSERPSGGGGNFDFGEIDTQTVTTFALGVVGGAGLSFLVRRRVS